MLEIAVFCLSEATKLYPGASLCVAYELINSFESIRAHAFF